MYISHVNYQPNVKTDYNRIAFQSKTTYGSKVEQKSTNILKTMALYILTLFGFIKKTGGEKAVSTDRENVESNRLNANTQVNTCQNLPKFVTKVDDYLYRGRKPDKDEFSQLHDMGITTIVDFSTEPSEYNEAERASEYGIEYFHFPFEMYNVIKSSPIEPFFDVIEKTKAEQGKLYVHCLQGTDRTGLMVNLYSLHSGLPIQDSNTMIKDLAKTVYQLKFES